MTEAQPNGRGGTHLLTIEGLDAGNAKKRMAWRNKIQEWLEEERGYYTYASHDIWWSFHDMICMVRERSYHIIEKESFNPINSPQGLEDLAEFLDGEFGQIALHEIPTAVSSVAGKRGPFTQPIENKRFLCSLEGMS